MNTYDTLSTDRFRFSWCTTDDTGEIDRLVDLFVRNAQTGYISHGEVIEGRAVTLDWWSDDLRSRMRREFSVAASGVHDDLVSYGRLCVCRSDDAVVGIALVEFHPSTGVAVLSDIVIDNAFRGQGAGESFMGWIEAEAGIWGARYIFLESGYSNISAHRFFERHGYRPSSVVMYKKTQNNK